MPVLRLTDDEFKVLCWSILDQEGEWTDALDDAHDGLRKRLRAMKKSNVKVKHDANKIWEALKGVVG